MGCGGQLRLGQADIVIWMVGGDRLGKADGGIHGETIGMRKERRHNTHRVSFLGSGEAARAGAHFRRQHNQREDVVQCKRRQRSLERKCDGRAWRL